MVLEALVNDESHVFSRFALIQNLNALAVDHWLEQMYVSHVALLQNLIQSSVLLDQRRDLLPCVDMVQRQFEEGDRTIVGSDGSDGQGQLVELGGGELLRG